MRLFTPATHRALHTDAYLIDTRRRARPLAIDLVTPVEPVLDALFERIRSMGRSVYAVRNRTFALFLAHDEDSFGLAVTEPFHEGVLGALRDLLQEFGAVRSGEDELLSESRHFPLLAYEKGRVSFFAGPRTRPWTALAGRHGLRVLSAALAHAPDAEVYVDDVPAGEYLAQPEETTLDLAALAELPEDELERLLDEQLDGWDQA